MAPEWSELFQQTPMASLDYIKVLLSHHYLTKKFVQDLQGSIMILLYRKKIKKKQKNYELIGKFMSTHKHVGSIDPL